MGSRRPDKFIQLLTQLWIKLRRDQAKEVFVLVEVGLSWIEDKLPCREDEIGGRSVLRELPVAPDRERAAPLASARSERQQDIIQMPTLDSRLEVEARDGAKPGVQKRLIHQQTRQERRDDVVFERESATARDLRWSDSLRHGEDNLVTIAQDSRARRKPLHLVNAGMPEK